MIFWANIRFYARYTLIHTALRSSLSLNWLTTINISNCVYPCVFKVHRVWGVSKYFIFSPQLCVRLVSLSLYSLQFAYHVSTGVYDTNIYLLHRSLSQHDWGWRWKEQVWTSLTDHNMFGSGTVFLKRLPAAWGPPRILCSFLFSLYISDLRHNTANCYLKKFSNDSAIAGDVG